MDVEPLKGQERLVDRAYEVILSTILRGQAAPGTPLSVPDLSRRLGISRSPVREAIFLLERDGVVVSVPHKGAVVAGGNPDDLRELYELREVLEGLAARLAATNMTDADLQELEQCVLRHDAAVKKGDFEAHITEDLAFHATVHRLSQNLRLIESLGRLQMQIRLVLFWTASQPGNPRRALKEHKAILGALKKRDPDLSEKVTREHIRRVRKTLGTNVTQATRRDAATDETI
jgi:DNA-binding GntR family transcriptional regulator